MRLSGLFLSLILVFSPLSFAQHSSSNSSGGSSGGGGGSHSGVSSGGSSASGGSSSHSSASTGAGGGHSSGAHVSGGSSVAGHSIGSGHSPSSQAPNNSHSTISHPSDIRESHSNNSTRFSHESSRVGQIRTEHPEKRGFFGFLRHPLRFRQTEAKPPVTDLRHPVCLRGPCQVCPNGQIAGQGGCAGGTGVIDKRNRNHWCSTGFMSNGGGCYVQSDFLDYCSAERSAMNRQAERLNGTQSFELSACANTSSNECFDARLNRQQEERALRELQIRYQQCMRRSPNTFSLTGRTLSSYRRGLNFDPTRLDSMEFGSWQSY